MKIAVIGATGMLGRPVTRKLVEAGWDVTVVTRNPASGRVPEGTRVVRGDLFDPPSLREALSGVGALYLNLSIAPGEKPGDPHAETDGLRNAIAAARDAGTARIGMISSLVRNYEGMNGFSWWAFRVKNEAVDILRHAGIPHLIFHPSSFMENFTHDQRRGNRILLAGRSREPMWFIAGDDYGAMVAKAFALPAGESREYPVQGPEPFTYQEAARVFVENHPGNLKVTTVPAGLLRAIGIVHRPTREAWHIITALNHYPERFESDRTWEELGRPRITLAEFARTSEEGRHPEQSSSRA